MNSSNLPTSIKKEHQYFPISGKLSKLLIGPKVPSAGPTFPRDDAAPPIAETKSSPSKLNTPAPIINKIKYKMKKAIQKQEAKENDKKDMWCL